MSRVLRVVVRHKIFDLVENSRTDRATPQDADQQIYDVWKKIQAGPDSTTNSFMATRIVDGRAFYGNRRLNSY